MRNKTYLITGIYPVADARPRTLILILGIDRRPARPQITSESRSILYRLTNSSKSRGRLKTEPVCGTHRIIKILVKQKIVVRHLTTNGGIKIVPLIIYRIVAPDAWQSSWRMEKCWRIKAVHCHFWKDDDYWYTYIHIFFLSRKYRI